MSFIEGHTVSSKRFDETGPTPLEERRLKTLDTLAQALSQLQKFHFSKIGSLEFGSDNKTAENSVNIGPFYEWNEGTFDDDDYGRNLQIDEFRPFEDSKSSYLRHCMNRCRAPTKQSPLCTGSRMILDTMISCLPYSSTKGIPRRSANEKETFVLSLPDFDSQNIMIDERGNLTGIIDWDNVQTVPRLGIFQLFGMDHKRLGSSHIPLS